jgi:diguanylate cyclase (GGDEF)-like protein
VARIMAQHTFAAIAIDIDALRHVNDAYGPAVGHQVLQAIAAELTVGKGIVARTAGDAFAILLEDRSVAQASAAAEHHRERLARLEIAPHGTIALKASCGVAGWVSGDTLDALLQRAEAALETAKRRGGDRVVAAEGPARGRSAAG